MYHIVRRVIHTVGPKYAVKYHTAAENALSHCYRSCLELLIDNGLRRFDIADAIHCISWICLLFCCFWSKIITILDMYECSIAMGCIYTEAKNYPREPAAHVAISEKISYALLLFLASVDILWTKISGISKFFFLVLLFATLISLF